MKKKFIVFAFFLLSFLVLFSLTSCGKSIEGITVREPSVIYDGTEHTVELVGLPDGAELNFLTEHSFTDAGVYEVVFEVKAEGYKTTETTVSFSVEPKLLDVDWIYKGPFHPSGDAPIFEYSLSGICGDDKVDLEFDLSACKLDTKGDYEVKVKTTNPNYKLSDIDSTLTVTFKALNPTVTFVTETNKEIDPEKVRYGKRVDEPNGVFKLGFTLDGWYNGDEKWDFSNPVTKDITLTAKWSANMYKLNYHLNGGVNSPENPSEFAYDKGVTLAPPTKAGYVFDGWYADSALTKKSEGVAPLTHMSEITYYAKWVKESVGHSEKIWVLGDNVKDNGVDTWSGYIVKNGFSEMYVLNSEGKGVSDILADFEADLTESVPVYAVWSFADPSDADYMALVGKFVDVCNKSGIIPVLSTHTGCAFNSEVAALGERYIDFASAVPASELNTELGIAYAVGRALSDVPEFLNPGVDLKTAFTPTLNSEKALSLGNNRVKDGKYFIFSAKLDGELSADAKINLCHGYMVDYGRWMELTADTLSICSYTSWADPQLSVRSYDHGITIKNFITVIITADGTDKAGNGITIITDGGVYTKNGYGWSACEGDICVSVENTTLTDASANWTCRAYSHKIWIIGASYLSLGNSARWPYYMYAEGYEGAFLVGRGGMGAQHGIEDLKDALKYGTPEYVIWDSVSGNNADKEGVINPKFLEHTLEAMRICKEKGIKFIIELMPNCPQQTNWYKNNALINRTGEFANYDYEIIDVPRALGAHELNNSWYPNMIHTDIVHPIKLGAIAYYLQMLCDFPELMVGGTFESLDAHSNEMNAGDRIAVDLPNSVGNDNFIVFSADFASLGSGRIEVGNDKTVDGATWISIGAKDIKVYKNVAGEAKLVHTELHGLEMKDLINVKIHIDGYKAKISYMSYGMEKYDAAAVKLFSFECDWAVEGDVFAEAVGVSLTDATLKYVTE